MSRKCTQLVALGRRQFLQGGAVAAAGATVLAVPVPAKAAPAGARLDYPSTRLANVAELAVDQPLDVLYPDADAPGVLLKLGQPVEGGVGPERDIVGFTVICPHKGYPMAYVA